MRDIEGHRHLPSADRLSLVAATILLAYALGRLIQLPGLNLATQLPGLYLAVQVNVQSVVAVVMGGLTAAGTDWLLREHPALRRKHTIEHWFLPALTAMAVGLPLFQIALSPIWWAGFALGGGLILLMLIAEYISVDAEDARQAPAAAVLIAVSFALFLVLSSGLRFADLRLFLLLPALTLAGGLVSLRTLRLRLPDRWCFQEAGLVSLITVQIAAALRYWPLNPVTFGLALLGPAYALTTLLGNLAQGEPLRPAIVEPAVVLAIIWGIALVLQ
jgi:Protein of unknown function (DUF5656)